MDKQPLAVMDTENFAVTWEGHTFGVANGEPIYGGGSDYDFTNNLSLMRWLALQRVPLASMLERMSLFGDAIARKAATVERTNPDSSSSAPTEAKP